MNQLQLIEQLMSLKPNLFLFGGFAEDAVLFGTISRPHVDIDVLVWLDELPMRIEQCRAFGFEEFEVRFEPAPGRPIAVGAKSNGIDLEFCVLDRTAGGRPFFDVPGKNGLRRVWLPQDMLMGPERTLDGVAVRTISPLALYQVRAAVTDVFGGMRPKDVVAQQALRDRYLSGMTEGELLPQVEDL